MKKTFKKFLCTFLSAIMIIQVLPMTVWGADYQNRSLPKFLNVNDKEVSTIKELSSNSNNVTKYLADDGSIVEKFSVTESNENMIATQSSITNNLNNGTNVTIYQDDEIENEPGTYTMDSYETNGVIVNVDTEKLGNVFVNNAYAVLHCNEISEKTHIYANAILNEYDDYSDIEISTYSDFSIVNSDNNNTDVILDITKPINSWLTGTSNNGLCIYSDKEFTFSKVDVIINYRNISDVDTNIEKRDN